MIEIWAIHGFLGRALDWAEVRRELEKMLVPVSNDSSDNHRKDRGEINWRILDLFCDTADVDTAMSLGAHEMSSNELGGNVEIIRHPEICTATSWSSWTESFIQQFKARAAESSLSHPTNQRYLIGYSLGGRLALQIFLQAPELWDHLFIIAAHPGLTSHNEQMQRLTSDKLWADRFRTEDWSSVINAWNNQPIFANTATPAREATQISEHSGPGSFAPPAPKLNRQALAQALNLFSLGHQPQLNPAKLKQEKHRITWIVGQKDEKFRLLYNQLAKDGIIGRLHCLPESGHRALLDDARGVAEVVGSGIGLW